MNDVVFLPAYQLAKGIRDRQFSAVEVLEAHLAQLTKHNSKLNAVVTLDVECARQQAQAADEMLNRGEILGSLHGVPITVKDNIETAGLRTTCSYKPLANYVPKQDAITVARLRAAGAIILGKTNLPKLAEDFQTQSPLFGRTNNPWNLKYTCGGSTGGGAVSIAAGLSPLELGNDTAGSVRIPAHFCGVFSLKPTEGRASLAGHLPPLPGDSHASTRYLQTPGLLARSIEDLRLGFSVIKEADNSQLNNFALESTQTPRPLGEYRFLWTDNFANIPLTANTKEVLENFISKLTNLGCQVESFNSSKFNFGQVWQTYGEIASSELYRGKFQIGQFLYRMILSLLLSSVIPGGSLPRRVLYVAKYLSLQTNREVLTQRHALIMTFEKILANYDAMLCPVCTRAAFPHSWRGKPLEVDGQKLSYVMGGTAHSTVFNLTGSPVVVIPIGLTQDGLPVGIQIVGKRDRDMELLTIAEKLTEATEGFQKPPGY
jgi:amidase